MQALNFSNYDRKIVQKPTIRARRRLTLGGTTSKDKDVRVHMRGTFNLRHFARDVVIAVLVTWH